MNNSTDRTEAIAAVAGAGFRLSLFLNAVKMKMQNADVEIQNISRGISDFALTLKHVARTMEAGVAHPTPLAIDTVYDIKAHAGHIFDEIKSMTELAQVRDEKGNLTEIGIGQKVTWCFKQSKVPYILGQLDYLRLNLVIMLQVLQLAEVYSPSKPRPTDKFIMQERAEIQNMLVLQHWSFEHLRVLLNHASQRERRDSLNSNASEDPPPKYEDPPAEEVRLAVNPVEKPTREEEDTSKALVKYEEQPVQQLDDALHQALTRHNHVLSAQVPDIVNHLLREWTIPEYASPNLPYQARYLTNGAYHRSSKYNPTMSSDEDDTTTDTDSDASPARRKKGYYLESNTPSSQTQQQTQAAIVPLKPAIKKKLRFANQQAQVESDSDSDDHRRSTRQTTKGRHILRSNDDHDDSSDSEFSPPPASRRDRPRRPYAGAAAASSEKEAVRSGGGSYLHQPYPPPPQQQQQGQAQGQRGSMAPSSPRQGPIPMPPMPSHQYSGNGTLRPPGPGHHASHPGTGNGVRGAFVASPNASPVMQQGGWFPQQQQQQQQQQRPGSSGSWAPQQGGGPPPPPCRPKTGGHSQHSSYEGRYEVERGERERDRGWERERDRERERGSGKKRDSKKSDASRNIKKGIGIGAAAAGLMELLSGLDGI